MSQTHTYNKITENSFITMDVRNVDRVFFACPYPHLIGNDQMIQKILIGVLGNAIPDFWNEFSKVTTSVQISSIVYMEDDFNGMRDMLLFSLKEFMDHHSLVFHYPYLKIEGETKQAIMGFLYKSNERFIHIIDNNQQLKPLNGKPVTIASETKEVRKPWWKVW